MMHNRLQHTNDKILDLDGAFGTGAIVYIFYVIFILTVCGFFCFFSPANIVLFFMALFFFCQQ